MPLIPEPVWRPQIMPYHPWRRFPVRVVALLLFAGCLMLAYGIGLRGSLRNSAVHADERLAALARLDATQSLLADARQQIANLEANLEIEREASASVRSELAQAQMLRRRLEQESELYRGLLNAPVRSSGLAVEELALERGSEAGAWHFRLILLQRAQRHVELSGSAGVTITGQQDGVARSLSLGDVGIPRGQDRLPLHLLYFQIIEGDLQLPDGFVAKEIRVDAQIAKGRPQKLSFKRAWTT